jgi:rhamnose utilization protein RhaD (predicted bifunctional aldolase and dehydrogenase)/NAD(P)-dependent dehydrogenase (short-subunit alcohol dehydrogenase family)
MPKNLWQDEDAPAGDGLKSLVYRSHLLGADRSVVNIYGGNTSVKQIERDHLGREPLVLWVKGSGSDIADITEQGFAGLRQEEILPLLSRESMSDEEMVNYLARCVFAPDRPRQSIETLLHAFTPVRHVDHTHPDAVISLACAEGGEDLCRELWGERFVWVDYIRPGFTLSKWIGEGLRANPQAELVVMGKHGLVTWGETSKECYERTINAIGEAEDFIASHRQGRKVFAGKDVPALAPEQRREILTRVMRDPSPRVILIPGVGMVTTGSDATGAEASRQLYRRAIPVIAGSEALSRYLSLSPQEAYDIEYWPLELYKLSLKPPARELAGRVAVVTGGASGIGRATARRLAADGAHVAILDINLEGAQKVAGELVKKHGFRRALAVRCDVSDEAAVANTFEQVVLAYGSADIVVSNAGIAISAPIEEATLQDWERTADVLLKGYFLVSREAFRLWKRQGIGGSLVYVASKNSVAAGKNVAIYSAAKAAELHLARCLAEEGGAYGIRVNTVLPDAVLEGSGIWDAGWREARARSYGIKPEELDEHYRQRTTLKVNVYPENIAEAISFFAGPRASRTTGGTLTVDGGVGAAYVR